MRHAGTSICDILLPRLGAIGFAVYCFAKAQVGFGKKRVIHRSLLCHDDTPLARSHLRRRVPRSRVMGWRVARGKEQLLNS